MASSNAFPNRHEILGLESLNSGQSIDKTTDCRDGDSLFMDTTNLLSSQMAKHQLMRTDLNMSQEPSRIPKLSIDVQAVLNMNQKKKKN